MKNYRFILVSVLLGTFCASPSNAQETADIKDGTRYETRVEEKADKYSVETNNFISNWFVGIGVGPETYFGDHDKQLYWSDRITPGANVYVGKWFTPGIGTRFVAQGGTLKGATHDYGWGYENFAPKHQVRETLYTEAEIPNYKAGWMLFPQQWNYAQGRFDVLFNLNQMIGGYRVDRFWHSILYAGIGVGYTWDTSKTIAGTEDHATELGLTGGWMNSFHLTPLWAVTLDVTATLFKDRFDGDYNPAVKVNPLARPEEGLLAANIGLSYTFGKRTDWGRIRNVTYIDNSRVNELKDALAALDEENAKLKQTLDECQTVDEVVKEVGAQAPIFVTFKINKIDLSMKARVNLGYFAEIIKAGDKDAVYIITGYADRATGTVKRNKWLSENRARVVYECLINEFGVDPSQLKTEFMGGVENMFYDDPALSRAVISKVVKKQ